MVMVDSDEVWSRYVEVAISKFIYFAYFCNFTIISTNICMYCVG
jgi:hypothetical protein